MQMISTFRANDNYLVIYYSIDLCFAMDEYLVLEAY
jgi:hypothetical protein